MLAGGRTATLRGRRPGTSDRAALRGREGRTYRPAHAHARAGVLPCRDPGGHRRRRAPDGHLRADDVDPRRPGGRVFGAPGAASAMAARTAADAGLGDPSARCSPAWNPVRSPSSRKPKKLTSAMSGSHAASRIELAVDRRLCQLVRDRDVLETSVARTSGRVDLPTDLVQVEAQAVHRRRLPRAVERIPQRLLDAVEVDEARVRPRVSALERIGRLVRIGMEAEASMSGSTCARSARYHSPSERRKRTGDVEMLFFAFGRSFPRGERPTPTTVISGFTPFNASYAAARYGPNAPAETFPPDAENWGRQNAGWFGSLPMTNASPAGRSTPARRHTTAKSDGEPRPASSSRGGYGYTASTTLSPAAVALASARSI